MKSLILSVLFLFCLNFKTFSEGKVLKEEIIEEIVETNTNSGQKINKTLTLNNNGVKKVISNTNFKPKKNYIKKPARSNRNKDRKIKTSSKKKIKRITRNYYIKEKEPKQIIIKTEKPAEKIEPQKIEPQKIEPQKLEPQKVEIIVKHEGLNPSNVVLQKTEDKKEGKEEGKEGFLKKAIKDYFLDPRHSGLYIAGGYGKILNQGIGGDARYSIPTNSSSGNSLYLAAGFTFAKIGNGLMNLFLNAEAFYHQFSSINVNGLAAFSVSDGTNTSTMTTSNAFSLKYMLGGKVRAGFNYSRIAFFATLGIGYSFITDNTYSITTNISYNNHKEGYARSMIYGGGFDILVTDWLFFRVEFTYTLIPFTTSLASSTSAGSAGAMEFTTKYRLYTILIGGGVKLPF